MDNPTTSLPRAISDQDLIEASDRNYDLGRKHGKGETLDELECLRAEVVRLTEERNDCAEDNEACHRLLDAWEGADPNMTSMDTLETRLKALLEDLTPVITDDDVNGDD